MAGKFFSEKKLSVLYRIANGRGRITFPWDHEPSPAYYIVNRNDVDDLRDMLDEN